MKSRSLSKLSLHIHADVAVPGLQFLRKNLRAAHARLSSPLVELSVALVGSTAMGRLHQKYLGIRGPTDVLTFELDRDAHGQVTAGEVVICVAVAKTQARRRGVALRNELLLYALHGMLHLSGWDDKTTRSYRAMHAMEDRLLACLGVGPVFGAS